jgi:hypothetical protein
MEWIFLLDNNDISIIIGTIVKIINVFRVKLKTVIEDHWMLHHKMNSKKVF